MRKKSVKAVCAGLLDSPADEYVSQEGPWSGSSCFFELAAAQSGELVNFSAFGRECGLPTRTMQAYLVYSKRF